MKEGTREGTDFALVEEKTLAYLSDRYGIREGHYKEFKRIAKKQGDGEVIVELRFREMKLMAFPASRFRCV